MNTLIPPPLVTASLCALMWWIDHQTQTLRIDKAANKPLAIAVLVIALGLMVATVIEFWRHRTTINPMKPSSTSSLVTTGVLRLSRNPIYLGDALLLIAWMLWLHSITAIAALPIFVAYITKFQIESEEAALRAKFASQFQEYCASVRRWI
jgi:protein-S-isoprenylcysteine O-methyltransferase Ste14